LRTIDAPESVKKSDSFPRRSRTTRCGDPAHSRKELCHGFARETASDKNQAGPAVVVGPVFKLDRRVRDVLDHMNDDRPTAFGYGH
jgi:hypothetical protein